MDNKDRFELLTGEHYGRLNGGFTIELGKTGYYTVSGLNNAGKSTLLQWLFSKVDQGIYLPAERGIVRPTIDSGTLQLGQYIDHLKRSVSPGPLDVRHFGNQGAAFGSSVRFGEMNSYCECLLASMIRDKGITSSFNELEKYVKGFSLGDKVEDQQDLILIDGRPITQMGTGARSLLMVILALIHSDYRTVFIDEPELFLEPRAQKALRDLLVETGGKKRIVVATHSHLFLDKADGRYSHNFYFDGELSLAGEISRCENKNDIRNLTFKLLGASFDDLLLPENYLVVEGATDFIFVSQVIKLIDKDNASKVQVSYAQGIQNVPASVSAIGEMLRPYCAEGSVYKDRVVCLIDEPTNDPEETAAQSIEASLNKGADKRCFRLGESKGVKLFLESAIPDELYSRTIHKKDEVLKKIKELKNNWSELKKYKASVSKALTESLTEKDLSLPGMSIFVAAANKALDGVAGKRSK